MEKVDILLPIYNSYEETRNCIVSILQNTDKESFNLFLLDDCSPDYRIQELINFYANKYSNIILIQNEKNLGFPGNVNNGFSVSENDVIVINSDTIVTKSWLTILKDVAYQEETIAAVNPMSNYGIISGTPTSNSLINDLFTFEELSEAFTKSNHQGYVEAPLLIGFCLYIKRKALNSVGLFDAAVFKRGYGEETDWCMRARQKGFKLIVAKEAYIHHIGGTSFGPEKEQLRNTSKQILLERYPDIDRILKRFVKANLLKDVRKQMMKNLDFLGQKTPKTLKLKMLKHYISNML
jgi:GT2 family glycosyltransferase